ncbi:MAG: PhoU domain-containing protein [Planctomycetota bacterium]
MFDWLTSKFRSGSAGLEKMRADFLRMLDGGRHMFDTAAEAFLTGADVETIRKDLFKTDKQINRAERQIRREIVVHTAVHGAGEVSACLVLMSIAKDAERVGDYGKNLFDLAEIAPGAPEGEHRDRLVGLKDRVSRVMAGCREVFESSEAKAARELIVEAKRIEDACDDSVRSLVQAAAPDPMAPAYVLAYRYFKRITAHMRNVASSIVQPVHKIDFTSKITAEETYREAPEK